MPSVRNQTGLIAYADRFGGSLAGLRELLLGELAGAFGAVHVLPFFVPFDGVDAGFDPEDHTRVDARLGTWEDVAALAGSVEVTADVIVNHASVRSPAFLDVVAHGAASPHAGMFLTFDAVFPGGASEGELLAIYRPRPGLPFTPVTLADGTRRLLWTTFTPEQADLDVTHPATLAYLDDVLEAMRAAGVSLVRLDAVGYAVKRAGTSCFMLPGTFSFIQALTARARAAGLEVLVEVHGSHALQAQIAPHVDYVYDFALPPLVLHGLQTGDAAPLAHWLEIRPANAITVLDTHDGIGIVDVAGDPAAGVAPLLDGPARDALVEAVHASTGGASRLATGAAASNLDSYQVNSTFYDALGRDDAAYELARLIQLFVPGIPQLYYVGLLAGHNDTKLLARTGVGRDINRHHYTRAEITEALSRPVVQRLLAALRLRNTHPAFAGTCAVTASATTLTLRWTCGVHHAELAADLAARTHALDVSDAHRSSDSPG